MRTLKHRGFGRYDVLDDTGQPVAGGTGLSKSEATAFLNGKQATEDALARRARETVARQAADRKHQKEIDEAITAPLREELAEIRAVLARRRDADEVRILTAAFEPMLKAGKQAMRRERRARTIIVPAKPAVAA